jgi:hypothetical protein
MTAKTAATLAQALATLGAAGVTSGDLRGIAGNPAALTAAGHLLDGARGVNAAAELAATKAAFIASLGGRPDVPEDHVNFGLGILDPEA